MHSVEFDHELAICSCNQEVAASSLFRIGVPVDYGCLQTQTWPITEQESCLVATVVLWLRTFDLCGFQRVVRPLT